MYMDNWKIMAKKYISLLHLLSSSVTQGLLLQVSWKTLTDTWISLGFNNTGLLSLSDAPHKYPFSLCISTAFCQNAHVTFCVSVTNLVSDPHCQATTLHLFGFTDPGDFATFFIFMSFLRQFLKSFAPYAQSHRLTGLSVNRVISQLP